MRARHLMQPAKAVPSGSKNLLMQSGLVTHATASHATLSVQQSMQVGFPAGSAHALPSVLKPSARAALCRVRSKLKPLTELRWPDSQQRAVNQSQHGHIPSRI